MRGEIFANHSHHDKNFFDFRRLFSQFKEEQFIREDFISQLRGKKSQNREIFSPQKCIAL